MAINKKLKMQFDDDEPVILSSLINDDIKFVLKYDSSGTSISPEHINTNKIISSLIFFDDKTGKTLKVWIE